MGKMLMDSEFPEMVVAYSRQTFMTCLHIDSSASCMTQRFSTDPAGSMTLLRIFTGMDKIRTLLHNLHKSQ